MLAAESVAERSRITGVDRDTVSEKARCFIRRGMFGLVDQRTTSDAGRHQYPQVVAALARIDRASNQVIRVDTTRRKARRA